MSHHTWNTHQKSLSKPKPKTFLATKVKLSAEGQRCQVEVGSQGQCLGRRAKSLLSCLDSSLDALYQLGVLMNHRQRSPGCLKNVTKFKFIYLRHNKANHWYINTQQERVYSRGSHTRRGRRQALNLSPKGGKSGIFKGKWKRFG